MLKHEARLIDPTPEQLVAALSAAATAANSANGEHTNRIVRDDPAEWRKFVKRAGPRPEGWELWRGGHALHYQATTTFVLAAWWTDPLRRRHFTARSWRVVQSSEGLFQKKELGRRPPLWHVYPEYCCLRHDREGTQLVCACGCGAVGTVQSLGWMGDRCGPCFDHAADGGSVANGVPGVLRTSGPLDTVACSPDGNIVVAGGHSAPLTPWNLTGPSPAAPQAVDAAALAVPRTGRGTVRLTDPGLALVVHSDTWSVRDLQLVRVASREVVRSIRLPSLGWNGGGLAVSPDETFAAVGNDRVGVVDLRTWDSVRLLDGPPGGARGVAFSPDGSRLFLAGGLDVLAYDTSDWKRVASGSVRNPFGRDGRNNEWVRSLTVDPNGEAVYLAGDSGQVYAFDPATLALRATLEWHIGPVNGLAVSADGSRLFSAGADGCVKVWPVRELLRGV